MTKLKKPPYHEAIDSLNPAALKEAIRDVPERDKGTLLHRLSDAIMNEHYKSDEGLDNDQEANVILILEELIRNGVDINSTGKGTYPIMHNCITYPGIVRELIRHGYDVDTMDSIGWTALASCCFNSTISSPERISAEILLAAGANPNLQEGDCLTPLMVCGDSYRGIDMTQVMSQLLSFGADVNLRDSDGCSALDYAILNGNKFATEFLLDHDAKFPHPKHHEAVFNRVIHRLDNLIKRDLDPLYWISITATIERINYTLEAKA